jgi:hypothetical protein
VNLMGRVMSASGGDVEAALGASDWVFAHTFIANAVADAVGGRIDTLPITAEKVLLALSAP